MVSSKSVYVHRAISFCSRGGGGCLPTILAMSLGLKRSRFSIAGLISGAITIGFCGFLGFASLEFATRTIFFPEWVGLLPTTTGTNPHFGNFNLPNLRIRRFSPANYDVVNTTNNFGFRDRQDGFESDLGGVWVFGDSNTFGMGLNDSDIFTELMNKAGIPTANLAGLSNNSQRNLRVLRRLKAMGYQPKAAVIALSMNFTPTPAVVEDLVINDAALLPAAQLGKKLSNLMGVKIPPFLQVKIMLLRNVATYGFVKTHLVSIPMVRDYLREQGLVQDIDLLPMGPAWLTDVSRLSDVEVAAAALADTLANMREVLGPIPFGVILLPNLQHLYPVRFKKFLTHMGMSPMTRDAAQPYVAIRSALEARHISVVEVLDALFDIEPNEPMAHLENINNHFSWPKDW